MALVLTEELMHAELAQAFPNAVAACSDKSYAVVARESVAALGTFLGRTLFGFRVVGWESYFDCDDYARLAHVLACIMHRKARESGKGVNAEAPAFGQVWYEQGLRNSHAVNWVMTEQGIEMWEPQNQRFIAATAEERESAWQVFA
jgi:hypothetical protein